MSNLCDVKILELLASKICHDLISPVGAVNNGVEFLQEMGADAGEDVTALISFSAAQATAKLKAFRLAYGAGGADVGIKPEEVYIAFEDLIKGDNKIKQDWDPHAPLGPAERPAGFAKLLMCALLLAHDSLPKGGTVKVLPEGDHIVIRAEGANARPREGTPAALAHETPVEKLEPKTVHPYISALCAKIYNASLALAESGDGFVVYRLSF